jgi:hypothetical protein
VLQQNRVIPVDYLAGCADFYLDDQERYFGDYSPGRWAWLLADVVALEQPIPVKGAQGLWNWAWTQSSGSRDSSPEATKE